MAATYRNAPSNELALSAKPLSLWNERNAVAFLVNGEVTPIAEHYGIGVLAVAVIANGTFTVLLLPGLWFTIDGSSRG